HPPPNALTLSQIVSFVLNFDPSVENTKSVTNILVNAQYNSQDLSFVTSPGDIYSQLATYTVSRGSIDQNSPVGFTFQAIDSFGNSSVTSSYITSFTTDSQIPVLGDLSLIKTSNKTSLITSDIVTLRFAYNTLSYITSIQGDVILGSSSTSLTFLSSSSPYIYSSTWSIPSENMVTNQLRVQNVVITENSGNQSLPITSYLTSSINLDLSEVSLLIDTLAPVISSISANLTSSTTLAINDSVTFSINPSIPESDLALLFYFNGFSLNSSTNQSGSTYSVTYTLLETHNSDLSGANVTNAVFTDSHLLTGPITSSSSFNFILDATRPVLSSISTTASKIATLILNDQIFFSVNPTPASSDTTSIAAWFNSTTLSFIPSSAHN
ncbi:hypothetical protein MJH12_16095, partial [bacterium]|nr:hypothetical protein [bacterium]